MLLGWNLNQEWSDSGLGWHDLLRAVIMGCFSAGMTALGLK